MLDTTKTLSTRLQLSISCQMDDLLQSVCDAVGYTCTSGDIREQFRRTHTLGYRALQHRLQSNALTVHQRSPDCHRAATDYTGYIFGLLDYAWIKYSKSVFRLRIVDLTLLLWSWSNEIV